ncbi:MAG: hypothetical protein UV82_C0005G0005 [Candidatus Magasanikbacteria bacterium GW2011_GWD2_43_18]|uniref:Uncharacterized protein n=1 Tax=Candidatus Magasanikbacteria bacterium GW2011_GWE2_42_7 TaxID=1619052 RepID=A0A0G1DJG2_9BACT|nr:MAG: hypothetical protein UV18_C0005G0187 [Candidatus Magasanikbacteria bacterium GW2011_GWC2_42_27]KKS70966.1 MAG: hypothetical protein UV42_C0039G0004 [Candidatus Magasanikbacteria bacterium GW2011_GWE2_42_7]KKT04767.1 MAG: hypothetical protein UV82_C0005G0005 [Candidatus Magasanikbacteria bacterium GW2011_GWD2_43_18]KKT25876.1 MAG: hypothetical protein UW10_C0003G0037 [Candidatus Magasanikbacteria bacterium GW2011_GWA2_43_9]HBB37856.1 hypothetical protein [Candidatus Magasanikbacteria bac
MASAQILQKLNLNQNIMDPTTAQILVSLATNYFTHFTAPTIQKLFQRVFQLKPDLENVLKNAKTNEDFEKVFREAVGVIDAQAGSGSIEVDNNFLEALRGIRFDHQNGYVNISGSRIHAPLLQTGGTGIGQTEISSSVLKSRGTQINVEKNALIKITGNAQIRQS